MKRVGHGQTRDATIVEAAGTRLRSLAVDAGVASAAASFGYMFPELQQDEGNVLKPERATVEALRALGAAMTDAPEVEPVGGAKGPGDSAIPAIYTYFGQFLDHDITFDETSASVPALASLDLAPLSSLSGLRNSRTLRLDLDSVYEGSAPRDDTDPRKMKIGSVEHLNNPNPPLGRPPGKSDGNDLPRQGRSEDPSTDRAALIGDPRNDENLIVSQLHLAFLKAHNSLVDEVGGDFDAVRTEMRRRYQRIVLTDFLGKVCDPAVLSDVMANGPRHWRIENGDDLFMPVEFAAAAYRFGHSMIRTLYDYNLNFSPTDLGTLFTFTALTGQLGENIGLPAELTDTLPENWIIQWERFVHAPDGSGTPQMAREIDVRLTDFTFKLQNTFGEVEGANDPDPNVVHVAPRLAVRNLLRGYLMRLPTGQAVAGLLGEPVLSGEALVAALPDVEALRAAARPFARRTPLWFYLLAEAGDPNGAKGQHLGRVGSRIVAEVVWNLVRHSADSVLANGVTSNVGRFTLAELIALAGRQDRDDATGSIGAWPVVRRGHRDHPVKTLQHLLRARGQAVGVDGVFGPETEAAVRAFQTGKGLDADGIVGPRTWAALIVTVRQGSSGDAVRGVQEEFQFRNLSGDPSRGLQVDGIFGPRTEEAVRGFQQALSLDVPSVAVDGIVGPITWRALVSGMLAG
ncbi:MAG: peptidoglycan-binding protein [Microvirga sp.]